MGLSFTESFNKADAATLGPDLSWTEVTGTDWGVTSNAATVQVAGTENHARADSDVSSVNHYCQATISTITGGSAANRGVGGPAVRFSSTAATFYNVNVSKGTGASLTLGISKWVAGVETFPLGATPTYDPQVGDVIRLSVTGNTLRAYVNGTLFITTTSDTAITTGTRGGLRGIRLGTGTIAFDNFVVGDLGVATPSFLTVGVGL